MNWLLYGILAAVSYGWYNFFSKLSGEKLHPALSLVLLSLSASIISIIIYLFLKPQTPLTINKDWLWPLAAGLLVGIAEYFYLKMYSHAAPLEIGNPLVVGGTIIVATILGIIFLKEDLNVEKIGGIGLILAGILLITKN